MVRKRSGKELEPMYGTWRKMITRCTKTSDTNYPNYGGRGISVEEPFTDFYKYLEYVKTLDGYENRVEDCLTIDRIENNDNYRIGNIRFATQSVQTINSRQRRNSLSNYIGVCMNSRKDRWMARLTILGKNIFIGNYKTELEALKARNKYIVNNELIHKIQIPL